MLPARGRLPRGPGSNPTKLSPEKALTAFGMSMLGFSLRKIADALGCTSMTVQRVLKRGGWAEAMDKEVDAALARER